VPRPKGLIVGHAHTIAQIYGQTQREQIDRLIELVAPPITKDQLADRPDLLADVSVVLTGWGGPVFSAELLDTAPHLKAVFHGAGSVRNMLSDAFWERGLVITSAAAANAVPVADFCLSQILFLLKGGYALARVYHERRRKPGVSPGDFAGGYRSRVGLVSFGVIARLTRKLLAHHNLDVVVYCPFMTDELAAEHDIIPASLDEVFATCPVVSLHTPKLPETRGMIRAEHFERMLPNAAFLNTARGAVVDEPGMIRVLSRRPDLTAVLDVTDPEPPAEASPLWDLPNVVLTPHVAGSHGAECQRMGQLAVDELARFLAGEPLRHQVTRERAAFIA